MKFPNLSKKQSIAILLLVILLSLPEIYLFIPYFLVIKPTGEKNTEAIISEVKKINQTDKKLERIAEWEAEGFTETFGNDPSFKLPGLLGWIGASYSVYFNISDTQPIKIRPSSIVFYDDPYWIAYFKTGACQERAYLFNFIANQSGEVTRIVTSPGNDHDWVEVYNGSEWIYADPTFYYHYHNTPGLEKAWMNETPMFQTGWGWHLSKVTILMNETELTKNYSDVSNLTIIFNSSSRVTVNQYIPGERRNVTLFSKYPKDTLRKDILIYQIGKSNNYSIIAEKNNIFFFFKRFDEKNVYLDNESITIVLDPSNGREEIDYLSVIFVALVIVVYSLLLYKAYIKRKKEKGRGKTPREVFNV